MHRDMVKYCTLNEWVYVDWRSLEFGGMAMENIYRKVVWDLVSTHRWVLQNYWKMDQIGNYLIGEIMIEPVPGDPTRLRLFRPIKRMMEALQLQAQLSAETLRRYREGLRTLVKDGKLSVQVIQQMARAYMEAWFQATQQPVWYFGKPYYCYSKTEVKRLADLATALYLESWLCQDETNFQTPYNMYVRPYEKLGKRKLTGIEWPELAHMKRRIKKAKTLHLAAQLVSEENRRIPSGGPYMKGTRGNLCDLVNATRDLAERADKLEIVYMLLEKKYVLTTAEERRVKSYEKTMDACLRYQNLIREAECLNTGKTDDLIEKKQFVATSMMLHRIERECRFHYHARLVQRMMEGTIDMSKFDRESWNIYFASQKGFDGQITADKRTLPRMEADYSVSKALYDPIDDAVDVLDIDGYLDKVYRVNGGMTAENRAHFASYGRAALIDMVRTLMAAFPPKEQHPWGEEEFYQAAKFYREDYPVVEELLKIHFPSSEKGSADYMLPNDLDTFYSSFVECYQNLEEAENSQLAMMRKARGTVK